MDTAVLVALVGFGGVIFGAGLTTLGSYLTTRANQGTVERQIAADSAERDKDRKFAVDSANRQAYRDERRSAHEEALRALDSLELRLMHEVFFRLREREPPTERKHEWQDASRAVSRVAFVASEPVRGACNAAMASLRQLEWQEELLLGDQIDRMGYAAAVDHVHAEFKKRFAEYEAAARRELGLHA